MHTELTISLFDDVSGDYLSDYWQILELRRRYWSQRNPAHNLVAQRKLHNLQLVMQAIWDELVRRADSALPLSALLLLIENGNSFSMNLNPRP